MNEPAQNGSKESAGGRWLVFSSHDRRVAVGLEHMVKILKKAEIFAVPLLGREFKGIFYYNDRAVPVLNWEALLGNYQAPKDQGMLILEQNDDLLGIVIDEAARVEEHKLPAGMEEPGFWIDLKPAQGLWALNIRNLFRSLRKGLA